MWRARVYFAARIVLAAVFIYAGILKAMDVESFGRTIAAYEILPHPFLVVLAASVLPYLEILAGAALLFRAWAPSSLGVLGSLTIIFMVCLASLIVRGIDIDCGCFSVAESKTPTSPATALWRDAAILLLIAVAVFLSGIFPRKPAAISPSE